MAAAVGRVAVETDTMPLHFAGVKGSSRKS